MGYLKEILTEKKKEVKNLESGLNRERNFLERRKPIKSLAENIDKNRVNIIAEIKRASPSFGVINDTIDVKKVALLYNKYRGFIKGISILTESNYFKGSPVDIKKVREVSDLPILRKDFIFHEDQIYQSLAMGANCILLISSILGFKKLKRLHQLSKSLGLDTLVEVHTFEELDKALDVGAEFIGINNRNLRDMKVNPEVTINILEYVSEKAKDDIKKKIFVCESGIESVGYIKKLYERGINAFLIGGYFMKSQNLDGTLSQMEMELKRKFLI